MRCNSRVGREKRQPPAVGGKRLTRSPSRKGWPVSTASSFRVAALARPSGTPSWARRVSILFIIEQRPDAVVDLRAAERLNQKVARPLDALSDLVDRHRLVAIGQQDAEDSIND